MSDISDEVTIYKLPEIPNLFEVPVGIAVEIELNKKWKGYPIGGNSEYKSIYDVPELKKDYNK